MVASIGFWLNYLFRGKQNFTREWIAMRIFVISGLIVIGLVLVLNALVSLVKGSLSESFTFAFFGTLTITLVLFEVIFLVAIREIEFYLPRNKNKTVLAVENKS
jgi:hypothetical protein